MTEVEKLLLERLERLERHYEHLQREFNRYRKANVRK